MENCLLLARLDPITLRRTVVARLAVEVFVWFSKTQARIWGT